MNTVDLEIFTKLIDAEDEDCIGNLGHFIYDLADGHIDKSGKYGGDYCSKETAANVLAQGYEYIEGEGGGEGQGEYCYGVFKLGEKFYKAEWSYYSYNGCEIGGIESTLREVEPVEKLVTVYE